MCVCVCVSVYVLYIYNNCLYHHLKRECFVRNPLLAEKYLHDQVDRSLQSSYASNINSF